MANGLQPEIAIELDSGENSNTHESSVTANFEVLWKLRKYLVLLGILAVSVTYNAGLTPPGGFWTNNTNGQDGHYAGDPVLRAKFFRRYEVFFYCNATAFASSLVLIILLLSKHVTRQKIWLRSMQFTMVIDLFSLMGAYAAGSCRAVKSSIYIWALVIAVFLYILIHILVFIRVVPNCVSKQRFVPKCLKKKVESVLAWVQSKCTVRGIQMRDRQQNDVKEARKFILMLVTFAASVTYQSGLSPPGGFWAENGQRKDPATSMLRSRNLTRYNFFVTCNSTSFVASLVTIILLLSPKFSEHGIRSKAMIVCVVVDLFSLVGAYAAGSCRSTKTSVFAISIMFAVWIFFALLAGTFVHKPVAEWLKKIKPDVMMCMDIIDRTFSLKRHRNRSRNNRGEGDFSIASHQNTELTESASEPDQLANDHKVPNIRQGEAHEEPEIAGNQQNANTEEVVSSSEYTDDVMYNLEDQSTDYMSAAKVPTSKIENLLVEDSGKLASLVDEAPNTIVGISNSKNQSTYDLIDGTRMGNSLSNSDQKPRLMKLAESSVEVVLASSHNDSTSNIREEKESSEESSETVEKEIFRTINDTIPVENVSVNNYEGDPRQDLVNGNSDGNPTDEHLKKSRKYLLLLASLAVSLTYQSGLNPPGVFWSKRENNNPTGDLIPKDTHHRPYHLPGDPILEDTHHQRYIAFFYLNAITFLASLVMIIMLLNRRISNKAIKRYALQTTMIVDLLGLTGSYVMGSCRKTKNSIYIWLLLCLIFSYVIAHVLISIHVIPKEWKQLVAGKLECLFRHTKKDDANEELEQRRNLLLIIAVLAVTVTYQAGMNPPGGVWSDDKAISGDPGDPVLQYNNLKRYNVFYYSNSVSFVSSVAVTILLVHKGSCEHGIKSYALRMCLIVGLVSLLVAYSTGSCRKPRESIYLVIIDVVVLVFIVIQVILSFSSTYNTLGSRVGKFIDRSVDWVLGEKEARKETTSKLKDITGQARQETTSRQQDNTGQARQETTSMQQDITYQARQEATSRQQGITCQAMHETTSGQQDITGQLRHETTSRQQDITGHPEKKDRKRHKNLMLLAILAASMAYQAGLNPPGGFWSDDNEGHVERNPILHPPGGFWTDNKGHLAGNPILLDINPRRYEIFFCFNSISFMASIVVIMFLLNDSVRKKDLPLNILHTIMIVDLLALMTAFAAGSCRKLRTSGYVYVLVVCVVIYLMIVILLSRGIAKYLCPRETSTSTSETCPDPASSTDTLTAGQQV